MNKGYWLRVTKRQLFYIIEGCEIDKPLVEHWANHFGKSPLILGEGNMGQMIASLERKARDALYQGEDSSMYPPGHKRRRVKVVH